MSHRGDKVQPVENKGKRSVFGVERQLPAPTKLQSCPAVVDGFGTTKVYSTDKFGAVQIFDSPCASFGSSLSRRNIDKTEYSTGSFTPVEVDCFENQEGGDQECDDAAAPSTKESVWSQYINSSGAATSYTAETARIFEDPTSNCSTPRSSTVDVASSAGPPIKRFCATLKHVSDAAPVIYNFHRANYKSEEKQELDQKRRVHALPLLTRRANEPQVSTMVASFKSPTSSSRIARSSMRFLNFKNIASETTETATRQQSVEPADLSFFQHCAASEHAHDFGASLLGTSQKSRQYSIDHSQIAPRLINPTVRFHVDDTILRPGISPPHELQNIRLPFNISAPKPAESFDLNQIPTSPFVAESSRGSRGSDDEPPERFTYRFASAGREAFLRQRMEERQRLQDAAPYVPSLPESHGAERCRHVIYPEVRFEVYNNVTTEDLIWASVKNYCGMVLDRETQAVLGTAVLFIPEDPKRGKPAWVTSVNTVEGRTEVLIKNCKGQIHISKLMLTSTAFGLAFFSIHAGRGTFALAFLSMVTGPARLPHRQYVDVDQGDRVYVFGYEEPWESEIGKIADVRVRPGRITDAGNQVSVEIDFTNGQLGGSITSPAGFKGGLVARADGIWAGVITGQNLTSHQTLIDFSPAYNVYSILEEL